MATELKATLDDLQVLKTLGKGAYAKVKLVQDQDGNQLAAKIMLQSNASAKNFQEMVDSEVKLMQQIDHPNVVKVLRTKEDGAYVKKNGDKKQVMYILMELASGGEMIEYLLQTGRFEDNICRTYFQQIISAIGAVHQAGISHRDLKPENILFDKDFNIKIADFGFAIYMSGRDGTGILKSHLGTESYMAPEIHEYKGYQGATIDLFALGIILFIMKSQNPPFTKAIQNDPWYQRLSKSSQVFWTAHNKAKGGNFYSAEFMDLINKMLAYSPQDRLTYEQIINHPWMQGPTVSQEDLKQEFQTRLTRIQEAAEKLRKQKEAQKASRPQFGGQAYRQGRVFRNEDFNKSEALAMSQIGDSQALSNRIEPIEGFGEQSQSGCLNFQIQQYTKGPLKWSQFLSKLTPEDLMDSLDCWLSKNAKDYEVKDQTKFKAKFEIEDQEVGVTFKLYVAEDQLLIDITKEFGSSICFQQQVKKILEDPEIQELSEGEPLIV